MLLKLGNLGPIIACSLLVRLAALEHGAPPSRCVWLQKLESLLPSTKSVDTLTSSLVRNQNWSPAISDSVTVDRTPDLDDGRATQISVSEDGARRLRNVVEHRRQWFDARLGEWSAEEILAFAGTLSRYNEALGG